MEEGIEADVSNGASLFAAVNDSIFKEVQFSACNIEGVLDSTKSVSASDQGKGGPDDDGKLAEESLDGPVLKVKGNDGPTIRKPNMDPMNDDIDEQISTIYEMVS